MPAVTPGGDCGSQIDISQAVIITQLASVTLVGYSSVSKHAHRIGNSQYLPDFLFHNKNCQEPVIG